MDSAAVLSFVSADSAAVQCDRAGPYAYGAAAAFGLVAGDIDVAEIYYRAAVAVACAANGSGLVCRIVRYGSACDIDDAAVCGAAGTNSYTAACVSAVACDDTAGNVKRAVIGYAASAAVGISVSYCPVSCNGTALYVQGPGVVDASPVICVSSGYDAGIISAAVLNGKGGSCLDYDDVSIVVDRTPVPVYHISVKVDRQGLAGRDQKPVDRIIPDVVLRQNQSAAVRGGSNRCPQPLPGSRGRDQGLAVENAAVSYRVSRIIVITFSIVKTFCKDDSTAVAGSYAV